MGSTHRTSIDVDTEKLKSQAAEIGSALSDAAVHAREWSTPRIEAFVEWLTPRLEKAYSESLKAAAPHVEKAAEKAGPAIDTAHDRLVDELIPKLVAAFNEAAEKAHVTAEHAAGAIHEHADAVANAAAGAAESAEARKSHAAAKAFFVVATLAAAGAAGAAWYRSRTSVDPWAEPWEPTDPTGADSLQTRPHDGHAFTEAVGDAADAVGEVAGTAVAKSREASRKAAERAAEVREAAEERVADVRDAAAERAAEVKDAVEGTARRVVRRPSKADEPEPPEATQS